MTGDLALIALRKTGVTPSGVWVSDSDDEYARVTGREWPMHREPVSKHLAAHIRIEASDIPEALDLRCVVGLTCHVHGDRGATRFDRLFDALIAAGARVVVGIQANGKGRFTRPQKELQHG